MIKKETKKKEEVALHPSGPRLVGHEHCSKGMIFSHKQGRCITVLAYNKEKGKDYNDDETLIDWTAQEETERAERAKKYKKA